MKNEKNAAASAFSVIAMLLCAGVLIIIFSNYTEKLSTFTKWERLLNSLMFGYLVFVFLRTIVHLVFSFADWFFQRQIKTPTFYPLVSVIVPCFNEETVVRQATGSLLKLNYPNIEILIVDDGSTDMTLMMAKEMETAANVRVIYQKNAGKAEALNRGIAEANGEYVLCVDADSILHSDVIMSGIAFFENDPNLAAVAGSVRVGNVNSILPLFQKLEYIVGLNFMKTAQSFLSMVLIVPGPVGLFRRDKVLAVGGYRSTTFAEDADLTIRLLTAGYRTMYCSKMIAVTEAPEDFISLMKQRYRWSRGMVQAIRTNSGFLFQPWRNLRNFAILAYMVIETVLIPTVNFLFAVLFVQHAVSSGRLVILGPYFIQLTLLDVVLTIYSVLFENQMWRLVGLAALNRLTYGLSLEVLRFFAILDELLGLPMNWNKLERRGL